MPPPTLPLGDTPNKRVLPKRLPLVLGVEGFEVVCSKNKPVFTSVRDKRTGMSPSGVSFFEFV